MLEIKTINKMESNEPKTLSISTVPVTIRVIEVAGKRMTKSVFTQIQKAKKDFLVDFDKDTLKYVWTGNPIGWVAAPYEELKNTKVLLFSYNGVLKKIGVKDVLWHSKENLPIHYDWLSRIESELKAIKRYGIVSVDDDGNGSLLPKPASMPFDTYEGLKVRWIALCKEHEDFSIFWESVKSELNAHRKTINNIFSPENQIFISI
jgi:hypothetical protein